MARRRDDDARPSQAIIVLGAAQYDGRPSPVFEARLDHAAELYKQGIAPMIVVTGGKQPGDRFTEAGAGADYLHARGVPDDAILRETTSRTSWESLRGVGAVPQGRAAITRVVLVSDPFHSLRIRLIAEEIGFDAVRRRRARARSAGSPSGGASSARRCASRPAASSGSAGSTAPRSSVRRVWERRRPGLAILTGPSGVV